MNRRIAAVVHIVPMLIACSGREPAQRWPFAVSTTSGITLVTDAPGGGERMRNATTAYGRFFVKDGCLQVRVGSAVFTPVLPRETRVDPATATMIVDGRGAALDREYALPFATEVGRAPGDVAAAIALPASCVRRVMSMGAPVPVARRPG